MMIVEKFPEIENGNYVVDIHNGCSLCFKAVVPHQMVYRYKNFWGAELTVMRHKSYKQIENVRNQPIKEKIFEHITDVPQTIDEVNASLRADGYNSCFDTDIKAFIYKLKAEDKVITQYEDRIMTVRRI